MEIVKKNILSVICGVIAVLALIALVWPISGMYDKQRALLNDRKAADSQNTVLIKAQRSWPVIPDRQTGEKAELKRFPNEEVIKKGVEIKEQVHGQALAMANEIGQNNKHPLLIDDILPNPRDNRFRFQQVYRTMVEDSATTGLSQLRRDLQGTMPPSDEDVHAEADRIWNAEFKPKIITLLGKDVNFDQVRDEWLKKCDGLQTQMRLDAAHRARLYVEPGWLSVQKQMLVAGNGPSVNDIWFAQNMLWVQQDVVDAIKRINGNARSVEESTIKHIFQLQTPDDQAMYVINSGAGAAPAPGPTDAPAKAFAVSLTGRVCNPLYDVIQFQLVMNVEAAKIPEILTELQRNKLITILQADHSAVNGIEAADNGYIYGNVPVARLNIRGEELFLRNWTVGLMPPSIQQMLAVPAAPAGAVAGK